MVLDDDVQEISAQQARAETPDLFDEDTDMTLVQGNLTLEQEDQLEVWL